jgi:ankyrin repeat protein
MVSDSSISPAIKFNHICGDDKTVSNTSSSSTTEANRDNKKIRKRRDGKTPLHYAARNGHIACIDCILSRRDAPSVDIPSGDGTTPLHMACYGGHPSTVRHLINVYHANAHATNEWLCGAAHWSAMSLGNEGMDAVIELCNYLKEECGVDFVARQRQGHTPLHKAASKKNQKVIEWLAGKSLDGNGKDYRFSHGEMKLMGEPDKSENIPSDIWSSVGGDVIFASWMKDECGW